MSEKFSFIDAEKANYPVTKGCRWLGVSRSGYYGWRAAPASATARRREHLGVLVEAAFTGSRQTYGARRVALVLRRGGQRVSLRLVGQLMAEQNLLACQPRAWRRTTVAGNAPAQVPDRLGRDFTAVVPGTRLVGDITYVRTWSGWVYLATVLDLATRKVIGWAMAEHMRTELIVDAVAMAHGTGRLAKGCVFHSDRGAQYTSTEFAAALKSRNMVGSMGRTGICWDNAAAESFFASLKNELVYRTVFSSPNKARTAIAEYIEVYYNRQRLHSTLAYRTPDQVEVEYYTLSQAA